MRIIGGKYQRRIIKPPSNLPVRPTTDIAKEALFNVLGNMIRIENTTVLDLFAGTGGISFEFVSRGAKKVIAVDVNYKCVEFMKKVGKQLEMDNIRPIRSDAFRFLNGSNVQFDIIFADPPYDIMGIETIYQTVFDKKLLTDGGLLVLEHPATVSFAGLPYFSKEKKYGKVHFSIFEANN